MNPVFLMYFIKNRLFKAQISHWGEPFLQFMELNMHLEHMNVLLLGYLR